MGNISEFTEHCIQMTADPIQPYLLAFIHSHLRSALCGHINMDTVSKVRICKTCVQTLVSPVLHSDCLSSNSRQTDVIVGTSGLRYCDKTDLLGVNQP